MIPVQFGPREKAKYGMFHAAIGAGSKGRSVVFCDALFDEAIRAHRALRFASDSMASKRWNSLRFDYYGTGDSAGENDEFSLQQANQDIHDAIVEAKLLGGVANIYLMGLRLGGTLAINCAVERNDIRGVVLWDPIIDGQDVIEEYGRLAESDTNGKHLGGYIFEESLLAELAPYTLRESIEQFRESVLMICTAPTPSHYALAEANPKIEMLVVEAPEAWLRDPGGGVKAIPAAVIRKIESWQG